MRTIPQRLPILILVCSMVWLTLLGPDAGLAKKPEDLEWIRLDAPGITVYSSTDEEKSREIVDGLIRFHENCMAFLPVEPFTPPVPTVIYLLSSESVYEDICDSSPTSANTAGLFNPAVDASYLIIDLTAGTAGLATVYHEYFHFLAEYTMPTLPLWANEGLAEFMGTYEVKDGQGIVGHPIKEHLKTLKDEDPMVFAEMFTVSTRSNDYHGGYRSPLFYAESWALVHSLLTGTPEKKEGFLDYLAAIARGMSAQEAMIETLDLDEQRLLDQLSDINQVLKLPPLPADLALGSNLDWQLDEPGMADVMSALGMFTVRLSRIAPEAPQHFFNEALLIEPENFTAHLGLALVQPEKHPDRSRKEFERALELAPTEPLVLDAYGEFLLGEFDRAWNRDRDAPRADIEKARLLFGTSLDIQPDGPRALAGYALSYHYDVDIPDTVMTTLDRAIAWYPARWDLLMAKCYFLGLRGDHEEAWTLFSGPFKERRPDRENIERVSTSLLNDALVDAFNTAVTGEIEEGRQILELAVKRYGNARTGKEAWREFEQAELVGEHNLLVDRYNQGVDALNAGDYSLANELLGEVAEKATDASLRDMANEALEYVRSQDP